MLQYPENANKTEKLLEEAIQEETDPKRRDRLTSIYNNITLCKEAIIKINSKRHLEILLPRELKKAEKELNIKLEDLIKK
jgi:hypothetical protein